MTLTEIKARMNHLIAKAKMDPDASRDGYKWYLSANVFTQLEVGHDAYRMPFEKINAICFDNIPVNIDYCTRDKIELWHNIDMD